MINSKAVPENWTRPTTTEKTDEEIQQMIEWAIEAIMWGSKKPQK